MNTELPHIPDAHHYQHAIKSGHYLGCGWTVVAIEIELLTRDGMLFARAGICYYWLSDGC